MQNAGSITANPNPIVVSGPSSEPIPVGTTKLSWSSEAASVVEVRVDSPDGPLLSRAGPVGSATTGPWVCDGMTFYLQDVSDVNFRGSARTLATVTVSLRTAESPHRDQSWQSALLYLRKNDLVLRAAEDHAPTCSSTVRRLAPSAGRPSIVVLSGITANNLGDDAALISVVRDIQRLRPNAAISVLAEDPALCGPVLQQVHVPIERSLQAYIQALLHILKPEQKPAAAVRKIAQQLFAERDRIEAGHRLLGVPYDLLPGLRLLLAADAVIDCGGANLTPRWKPYFYEKCLDYLLAAKPLFVSGQGVDPLADPDDVELLADALSRADEVTLREKISGRYVETIGCKSRFCVTGDDALTLRASSAERARCLVQEAGMQSSEPFLALQYRCWDFFGYNEDQFATLFARYVDEAIEATGLPILGVPMHFGVLDERKHLRSVGERVKQTDWFHSIESHITPGDAKALFAQARLAFGVSYHSAIFSLSSAVPFLGLYPEAHYRQKMHGLSELYGYPQLPVPLASTTPEGFGRILKDLLNHREDVSNRLRRKNEELLQEVLKSRERFLRLVRVAPASAGEVVEKKKTAANPRRPAPLVGRVRFGNLRRLEPISGQFGFDRGLPVDRHYIGKFLAAHASDIWGRVLEVGDDTYTRRFGGSNVVRSDVLNLRPPPPATTIVGDLADAPQIPSGTFDCVILTQTLQYIYDLCAAVRTLHRILKPGGVVLATVPGITQTYDPHWQESWFWSFTALSARRIFEEAFLHAGVAVETFGNVLTALCFLEGIAAEELQPEELEYRDPAYAVTIGVRAMKQEADG